MRALSLLIVLLLAKALIVAAGIVRWSPLLPLVLLWQDVLFVLVYAVLDRSLRRRPHAAWSLYTLIILYVALNVPIACELSTPLTMPMLRAARGTLSDSILHHVTALNLARIGLLLMAASLLPFLFARLCGLVKWRTGTVGFVTLLAMATIGAGLTRRVDTLGLHRNCFVTLLASAFPRLAARDLDGDWRRSPYGNRMGEDLSRWRGKAAGRNVVLIHLESAAAQYLRCYGAQENPMPTLTRLAEQSLLFESAYTVFPETIKSFVAVHSGIHPALDVPSERYETLGLPALGNRLQEAGYRTGVFHAGRFSYLGMDEVVRSRGFATREDAGDIGGEHDSSFGIEEKAVVRRMLQWIDDAPRQPFFLTYLPIAGHHPYARPDGGGPFPQDSSLDRYRNALAYADDALSQLLDGLKKRDLYDSTLFVILGDHGQAFGQHPGNFGHTLFLYEENVRVPLLVVVPGLIENSERTRRVASLVDVTPTVLDLLGFALPEGSEGHSLLQGPERIALFCTDYALGHLGLRDGPWKCLHEVETGRTRLFRLDRDPDETDDMSDDYPERVEIYTEQLLSWAASQRFKHQ